MHPVAHPQLEIDPPERPARRDTTRAAGVPARGTGLGRHVARLAAAAVRRPRQRAGWVYSRRGYGLSEPVRDVRGPPSETDGVRNGRLLPDYMQHEAWSVLPRLLDAAGPGAPGAGRPFGRRHDRTAVRQPPPGRRLRRDGAPYHRRGHLDPQHRAGARRLPERRPARTAAAIPRACRLRVLAMERRLARTRHSGASISAPIAGASAAPVLAIQGTDDPYGTLAQIDEIELPDAPDHARQCCRECGHSPHRDQTESRLRSITDFLLRLP